MFAHHALSLYQGWAERFVEDMLGDLDISRVGSKTSYGTSSSPRMESTGVTSRCDDVP